MARRAAPSCIARPGSLLLIGLLATAAASMSEQTGGDARPVDAALERALADGWSDLKLEIECRDDGRMASAEIHGSGIGIWNRATQFRLSPNEIRELLATVSQSGFALMPESFGGKDDPADAGNAPPLLICRVRLSLDGATKQVVQFYRGRQSKELRRLADRLLQTCRASVTLESASAASLQDGLDKIAEGVLAPESLYLHVNRRTEDVTSEGDWILRIEGARASLEMHDPAKRWTLTLASAELAPFLRKVRDAELATLPVNLYAEHYTDVVVRVLDWESSVQARQFAGLSPTRHGDRQARFDRLLDAVEALRLEVAARGRLELGHN